MAKGVMRKKTNAKPAVQVDESATGIGAGVSIDQHIGARIRARRRLLELTQDDLAVRVGVTAQQVHKYENGSNRVSASKLFEIATALTLPISDFFEGLPFPTAEPKGDGRAEPRLTLDKDLADIAVSFDEIEEERLRRVVLKIIKAAADAAQDDDS